MLEPRKPGEEEPPTEPTPLKQSPQPVDQKDMSLDEGEEAPKE